MYTEHLQYTVPVNYTVIFRVCQLSGCKIPHSVLDILGSNTAVPYRSLYSCLCLCTWDTVEYLLIDRTHSHQSTLCTGKNLLHDAPKIKYY